ncbi:hypothetical protein [Luteolibacter marinus]|uniref:hypothetical protein n=1 Tax=Luteolibacter marinus TaxID=2776705 RepID=UPI001D034C2F|nr:hypothetical protein [Luteolibacter marinus]
MRSGNGNSQPGPRIDAIAAQVLARFRGVIRANPNVSHVGPAGTLPDFCFEFVALIGRLGQGGLNPVPEGMTDPRRDEYRNAEKFLESLRTMEGAAFSETDSAPASPTVRPAYGGSPILNS